MEKIAGQFLRVREEKPGELLLEYRNRYGKVSWVNLDGNYAEVRTRWAKQDLDEALLELPKLHGDELQRQQGLIDVLRILALTSEIYAAYCRHENLSKFFSKRPRLAPESTLKNAPECELDFEIVERLKHKHPNKRISEIFQLAADQRDKSAGAVKGGYYYEEHRRRKNVK